MNQSSPEDNKQAQTLETKMSGISGLPHIDPERLKQAKIIVDHAIQTHKVFSVQGCYPIIRKALKDRGWVEWYMPRPRTHRHKQTTTSTPTNDTSDSDDSVEYQREQDSLCSLMCCMLRNEMLKLFIFIGQIEKMPLTLKSC